MEIGALFPTRPRGMPWNITILLTILSLQAVVCILMVVVVALIHPVMTTVHSTLGDVTVLVPEMNATLTDVKELIPQMKNMIHTVNRICTSVACR